MYILCQREFFKKYFEISDDLSYETGSLVKLQDYSEFFHNNEQIFFHLSLLIPFINTATTVCMVGYLLELMQDMYTNFAFLVAKLSRSSIDSSNKPVSDHNFIKQPLKPKSTALFSKIDSCKNKNPFRL